MSKRRNSPVQLNPIETHMCGLDVRLSILHRVPFFAGLPHKDVEQINLLFREYGYAAGETIYFSGARARHLYVVASGQIKLLRHTVAGQDILVDVLSPGDFFGTLSSFDDAAYSDTAQAQTSACVLAIAVDDFRTILTRHPAAALAVLDITSKRLHEAHEMLRQISAYPVEQRIAYILLRLAEKLGEASDEGLLIQMPLTRDDIAQMTGATAETASRVMSQFQKDGVINSGRQWVAIADRDRLTALAESA